MSYLKLAKTSYCMTNERTIDRNFSGNNKPKPSTPAMRLGLIRKLYIAEDLLSFSLDKVRINKVYRNKIEHLPSFASNQF